MVIVEAWLHDVEDPVRVVEIEPARSGKELPNSSKVWSARLVLFGTKRARCIPDVIRERVESETSSTNLYQPTSKDAQTTNQPRTEDSDEP